MTLSFNEDVMRVSQIYVPIRVLSLEIREGHYAEVALCERERGRSALSTECWSRGGFAQASMLNVMIN